MNTGTNQSIQAELEKHPGRRYAVCRWQDLFSAGIEEKVRAQKSLANIIPKDSWSQKVYIFPNTRPRCEVTIYSFPKRLGQSWGDCRMTCTCQKSHCIHMAASLMAWEEEHGPWIVWESESDYNRRMAIEAMQHDRQAHKERARALGLDPIPAIEAFQNRKHEDIMLFDLEKALANYTTTRAEIAFWQEAEQQHTISFISKKIQHYQTRTGKHLIEFGSSMLGELDGAAVWGQLTKTELEIRHRRQDKLTRQANLHVYCEGDERRDSDPLDMYDLMMISRVWDAADSESEKKVTDDGAEKFFTRIQDMRIASAQREIPTVEREEKACDVELLPRIVLDNGAPTLSFKIGVTDGKKFILKDCYQLINALNWDRELVLGKSDTLDFSHHALQANSQIFFEFIQRNANPSRGGFYQISLSRGTLDTFYDLAQGGTCELLDKTNHIKDELISIGHMDIRFTLTADRLADARDTFMGVVVSGFTPMLISGSAHKYVINRTGLSRISSAERKVLEPFLEVADDAGYFRFQVGKDRLQEFYYHVLPGLLDNPFVEFIDNCSDEASNYLPPEPSFTFLIDYAEDSHLLSLQGIVRYETVDYELVPVDEITGQAYRDKDQERRVVKTVSDWAPTYNHATGQFQRQIDDDGLYDFLMAGIPALEYYGEVKGSSTFRTRRVIPEPHLSVGISVEAGKLLNITVTSQSLSPDELVALFESYTQKKRFYCVKSGDFIDLTQDRQLGDLEKLMLQMDIDPITALRGKIQLPVYRSLYLNKMLEEHEALATIRDRTYRALIRDFKTVRDAEFEVPEHLESVLRPYQVYGYKWLRTLQSAGFGGILADEMGLGKTLQMISLFHTDRETQKDAEFKLPSLVVCPASLVYNWQAEFEHFAPTLTVSVLAGTSAARKEALTGWQDTDVYITSYDLLKRDIQQYEKIQFQNCVLDEAQYIKNPKSAASKTVKLIHAQHRFALTGTPIENRLSELWSIFDFIMPGFLHTQKEFERQFELPIVKNKDADATEHLKSLTAPFILRRLKMDVLTDLPAKLEEVRYARVSGEQQKLYDAQVVRMKQMFSGDELNGEGKIKIFAELTRIRQICCDPSLVFDKYKGESAKREACMELIQSAMEGGHRMLVFSQFVSMLELLESDLTRAGIAYYKIVGSTSKEKRISLVRAFNEGTVPVFLISLKAGGTGLNLTGADVVIHYDPWWNLAVQNQATDRAHRIGQTRQVIVYKLILRDTIEERILQLQDAKKDLAEAILEGRSESLLSLSTEELMALLS